jgi:hypothetical protein
MRIEHKGNAKKSYLTVALGNTGADLIVNGADLTGWPDGSVGPFYGTANKGKVNEEKILFSSRAGNQLTVWSSGGDNGRGMDDTTIQTHDINSTIEHTFTAEEADAANAHMNDTVNHVHPQYPLFGTGSILTQTGSYTLDVSDQGATIKFTNAGAATVTVPPYSSQPFTIGRRVDVVRYGAGTLTIAPGAGVTLRSVDNERSIQKQYAPCSLLCVALNEWLLVGDLVP